MTRRLEVRVIPRSSRNGTDGFRDGRLVVRVTAPPVDSAANDAVIETLSKALRLPKRAIHIVTGHSSRNKVLEIDGMDDATFETRSGGL